MRHPSLTRQLIWTLGIGAAVLWLLVALLTMVTLRARLDEAFDSGMRETAERLLPLAVDGFRDTFHEAAEGDDTHEVPLYNDTSAEFIVYQVRRGDGGLLLRSHDAPAQAFEAPLSPGISSSGPWRVYTLGTQDGSFFIQVAENADHRAGSLVASMTTLLLPIGILLPLSALGIFLAVRRGLRPVAQFAEAIGTRQATNLAPIGAAALPSELLPIATAVDELIVRVRLALEAERSFAANSAHELRTPIAGALAQTQRLIAELDGAAALPRARQVEASLVRLRQLSEKLLQLSRAEAGIAAVADPVDLLPALAVIVEDARRAMPDPSRLVLATPPRLNARIDLDAFGIVLRNLLDNAQRHGATGGQIEVTTESPATIIVTNAGPVVPSGKLAALTQRFVRGHTSADGSGLGLAIVETIVTQSGGKIELLSPAPGRTDGFCARVTLPA